MASGEIMESTMPDSYKHAVTSTLVCYHPWNDLQHTQTRTHAQHIHVYVHTHAHKDNGSALHIRRHELNCTLVIAKRWL